MKKKLDRERESYMCMNFIDRRPTIITRENMFTKLAYSLSCYYITQIVFTREREKKKESILLILEVLSSTTSTIYKLQPLLVPNTIKRD